MLVKDVMSHPAICIDVKTSIKDAIDIMEKEDLGFLPITKNGTLVGVVTDRDILLRSRGKRSNSKISNIMSKETLYTINEDSSLSDAGKIMGDYKIRRLVVINNNKIVGIITSKDLLKEKNLLHYIEQTYQPTYY